MAIVLISLLTRFWQLEGVAEIVFDEVYYPEYAQAYLNGLPQFDAHPPLGKYLIALGIQLFGYNPIGYRWVTALVGSLVPGLTCCLVYELAHQRRDRHSWALLAGLFTACDGLLLVESRYGLINIFMVAFGLLSQICIFKAMQGWALANQALGDRNIKAMPIELRRSCWWLWLMAAGIFLGAAVAVKWNGMAYGVGILIILAMFWDSAYRSRPTRITDRSINPKLSDRQQLRRSGYKLSQSHSKIDRKTLRQDQVDQQNNQPRQLIGANLIYSQRSLLICIILGLMIMPLAIYGLAWLPHLQLLQPSADSSLLSLLSQHTKIWAFHQGLGNGATAKIHPYCSRWWSWIFTLRPIAYFYEELPNGLVRDVTALGNPFLYWLGAIAIFLMIALLIHRLWTNLEYKLVYGLPAPRPWRQIPWLVIYMVGSFAAHLLPWGLSDRCTFLYLYMPASIYAFMAIALITDWCWRQGGRSGRLISSAIVIAIVWAFIHWLPIYLGWPISAAKFRSLMWFDSWI